MKEKIRHIPFSDQVETAIVTLFEKCKPWLTISQRRLMLFLGVVGEIPNDLARFVHWIENNIHQILVDWMAFTSSVWISTSPVAITLLIFLTLERIYRTPSTSLLDPFFEAVFLFSIVALIGTTGVYAIRSWNRISRIAVEHWSKPNVVSGDEKEEKEEERKEPDEVRRKKYRYWIWATISFAVGATTFFELERRGFRPNDVAFPYDVPTPPNEFTDGAELIWFLDGLVSLVDEMTFGEGIVFMSAVVIPASLIAYGMQIHVTQMKEKNSSN